jgi:Spy/CpxP family protein refolding chaperone
MQRSKFIALMFYVGALLVGAAVGITADRTLVRDWLNQQSVDGRDNRERFFAELRLTPEQRIAWDSIQMQARRGDSVLTAPLRAQIAPLRPQLDSIARVRDAALRALLTPEQQRLFDERQARRQRPGETRK